MAPLWSMGKKNYSKTARDASPSPCTYNPKMRSTTPSWSMHGTNIKQRTHNIPGPGAYDPKEVVKEIFKCRHTD